MAGTSLSKAALDALFEPLGAATKAPDTGLQISGIDISNDYYPLSAGGTALLTLTRLQSNGTDIRDIFAEVGTVNYQSITWSGTVSLTASSITFATASITLVNDGTTTQAGVGTTVGDWLSPTGAGDGANYECIAKNIVGTGLIAPTTFTPVSSNQIFSLSGNSGKVVTFDLEIREIANTANTFTRACSLEIIITGGGGGL